MSLPPAHTRARVAVGTPDGRRGTNIVNDTGLGRTRRTLDEGAHAVQVRPQCERVAQAMRFARQDGLDGRPAVWKDVADLVPFHAARVQCRFPLRIHFAQLRVHEAGAGLRGLCELIEVAHELDDFIGTGGRAPVIVSPGFAREDWIIFMSQGRIVGSRHGCGTRLGRSASAQLPSAASMVGACLLLCAEAKDLSSSSASLTS